MRLQAVSPAWECAWWNSFFDVSEEGAVASFVEDKKGHIIVDD